MVLTNIIVFAKIKSYKALSMLDNNQSVHSNFLNVKLKNYKEMLEQKLY